MHQPGDIHHVMAHGIDSLNLFETAEDGYVFTRILEKNLNRYQCHCYGYALMNNHYHLILRPSGYGFSSMMRVINSTFARHINNCRGRRGYVFRDRFKSIPTRDLSYVRNLIQYLHANPLRAGMVETVEQLGSYAWTSHQALLGTADPTPWLHADYMKVVLSDGGSFDARQYLQDLSVYTKQGFNAWEIDCTRELPPPQISSGIAADVARWVRQTIHEAEQKRLFQKKVQQQPGIIQTLLDHSCACIGVPRQHLETGRRSRKAFEALKLFSYWAIVQAGFSATLIGRLVQRSNTAVLRASTLGEKLSGTYPFPIIAS
jgi:REP element-mobilizing transposase RayT